MSPSTEALGSTFGPTRRADLPAVTVPILLVDDNAAKRLAMKAVLGPLGHTIVEAASGEEALRCVMEQDFAVVLLDVCMPRMDGFETASLIRRRRQSEMTPIIFITAYGSDEIVNADLYAEGAVDFMFAPVPPNELRSKVSVFANLFRRSQELARLADEVRSSADQLQLLAAAAPIGIFQTDAEDRYLYTNEQWSQITGVSAADALGRVWGSMSRPVNADGRAVALSETAAAPGDVSQRSQIEVPGEEPKTVVVTSRAISDGAGSISGWVGTLADVTAETMAEEVISHARDQANEASQLKSDFLANMSHEIRTPMNGVIGMTDLLLETDLDPRQRDYAQTVRNSGEALLAIIDDILDFSKVEAGKLDIEDIEFDPRMVVDDIVDLLAGPAQAKGLELVAVIDAELPGVVSGDGGRMRQVVTNLIGNAIKFTTTGEIVMRVTVAAHHSDAVSDLVADAVAEAWCTRPECASLCSSQVIRFEVSDTGVGIAPDKVDDVFQPFVQADTSTSRRYGGTGLGLAISNHLVTLMGGACGVTSRLGEGSTFWFTVRVHPVAGSTGRTPERDPTLAEVSVLVVDDSATQRAVLTDQLAGWGMVVEAVGSGPAALDACRRAAAVGRPVEVILLDQDLGPDQAEGGGLAVRDELAAEPSIGAPIVLMAALEQERQLATEPGIAAVLSKPIHRIDLLACLRIALGRHRADDDAITWAAAAPHELASGRLLLAEDNLINQKVAVAMLTNAGYRVDTVLNGTDAVTAAASRTYDAILMDCQMPELSGYEATVAIRGARGASWRSPIIAMTAGARREDRERCLAAGMDDCLSKPVNKDALLSLLAQCLGGDTGRSHSEGSIRRDDVALIDGRVIEELRLIGGADQPEFLTSLIEQFVIETDLRLAELRRALEAGDSLEVGQLAHAIRGSSAQLGGRRLTGSCGRLETMAMTGSLATAPDALEVLEDHYRELCRILVEQLPPPDRSHFGTDADGSLAPDEPNSPDAAVRRST